MSSYQDIDIRLKVAEEKLDFLMKSLQMQAAIQQTFLGPDGQPAVKVVKGSMLDFYLLSKQNMETVLQSDTLSE